MKTAAICVSTIMAMMVAAIGAGLILGFCFGVFKMHGIDVVITIGMMNIHQGTRIISSEPILIGMPIYVFIGLWLIPVALLAVVATAFFGRSTRQREA